MRSYLFDVDGVLLDETGEEKFHPELMDELIKRLKNGSPVGLNTGRSLSHLEQSILPYINTHATQKERELLFVAAEKGTVICTWAQSGKQHISINSSYSVPDALKIYLRDWISTKQYGEFLFYDASKQSMASFELKPTHDPKELADAFPLILSELKTILGRFDPDGKFRMDSTKISIDIEHTNAGKELGTTRFIAFCNQNNIPISDIWIFGDSKMDLAMLETCKNHAIPCQLFFLGNITILPDTHDDAIVIAPLPHCAGTLHILTHEQ